jgi:hypothetical protein
MQFITLQQAEMKGDLVINASQIVTLEIAAEKGAKTIVITGVGNYFVINSIDEIKRLRQ